MCRRVWYCGQTCLTNDSVIHSFECHPTYDFKELIFDKCSNPELKEELDWIKFKDTDELITHTLLLLRILFRLKSEPNCETKTYSLAKELSISYDQIVLPESDRVHRVWEDSPYMENEQTITADLIDDLTYNFGAWFSTVKQVLQSEFMTTRLGPIHEDVLMRAFRIVSYILYFTTQSDRIDVQVIRYALYVCDMPFINEIGKAFYIEMCCIRHSCVPNCGPFFADTNELDLRLLDSGVTDLTHATYDFQVEMTAYSAQELAQSLMIRNIVCNCKKCSDIKSYDQNHHKRVAEANLKYGNWMPVDYCLAMSEPIEEALDYMDKVHGKYHPFKTGLLLWKLRNEWKSMQTHMSQVTNEQLIETYNRAKDSVLITHGSDHVWCSNLESIGPHLIEYVKASESGSEAIDRVIDQIIPRSVIDDKLA